jgi:LPXTG-motif cell wall-anchored protein
MHYLFILIGLASLVIIFVLLLKKRKVNGLKHSNERLRKEVNKLESDIEDK